MNRVNQIASVDAGNVRPIVLMEDESVHAAGHKCGDSSCPCFDDEAFTPPVADAGFQECPKCGLSWNAHTAWIVRREPLCEEAGAPLVVGERFQGMMDSLLIEDRGHARSDREKVLDGLGYFDAQDGRIVYRDWPAR